MALPLKAALLKAEETTPASHEDDLPTFTVCATGVNVSSNGLVTVAEKGKLGMLYVAFLQALLTPSRANNTKRRARWVHRRTPGLRWQLLLSEAQGQSINWKKMGSLGGDWRQRGDLPPLVNFSRGFKVLCRKAMLCTTLRDYAKARPEAAVHEWFPASFVFYPAKPEKSEKEEFLRAFHQRQERTLAAPPHSTAAAAAATAAATHTTAAAATDATAGTPVGGVSPLTPSSEVGTTATATTTTTTSDDQQASESSGSGGENTGAVANGGESPRGGGGDGGKSTEEHSGEKNSNVWILKPSDGGKGEKIKVMGGDRGPDEILAFLEGQPEGSISWVVSEYLERPLLLPGRRKFDWRLWVHLDTVSYQVRLYREGVLRTCSVPYSLDNLNDEFAHLSNHCIQVGSSAFGTHEPTNEMFYAEFAQVLGGSMLEDVLLPQARRIIVETLLAARETLECDPELTGCACFNVFGFDLMVDSELRVKLIEVNSSPAVADDLLEGLVNGLVDLQVDHHFFSQQPPPLSSAAGAAGDSSSSPQALGATRADGNGGALAPNDDVGGWEVIFAGGAEPAPISPFHYPFRSI